MDLLNLNTFAENILYFYRLLDEENKMCLPKTIKHSFISVFDRTTNREEFEKLCYTFSMLKAHINDPKYEDKWSLYYSYEEKFKKFYKNLFKYEVYKLNSTSQFNKIL